MLRLLGLALSIALIAEPLLAQDIATLAGRVVHKTSKAGIPAAEVLLAPSARRLVTDSAGHFRFDRVQPGNVSLVVRRLGFAPESATFIVQTADDLELLIEMAETAQPLDTVTVAGPENVLVRGKLAGFYERKRFGIGRFLEAADLEKLIHRQLADVLSSRVPGVQKLRQRGRPGVFIATSRLIPLALAGGPAQPCFVDVYLDGVVVYTGGAGMPPFDVNAIDPSHVSAIEFYSGPAQTPAQYNKTGSACGVLLIWTK